MCAKKKERNMIKKHVFALVLPALFIAGIASVTTAGVAEAARLKRECHTHYQAEYRFNRWHCHTKQEMASHDTNGLRSADKTSKISPEKAMKADVNSRIINIADDYIGLSERKHRRQLMNLFDFAFTRNIDPARTPWCAVFVNSVLKKSGKPTTDSAQSISFLKWGKKTNSPVPGDVVVLRPGSRYHVGFYMGTVVRGGVRYIKVLGGNQSNQVKISYYRPGSVVAYRTAG